jgi:hypothetical protein
MNVYGEGNVAVVMKLGLGFDLAVGKVSSLP